MKLLGRRNDGADDAEDVPSGTEVENGQPAPAGTTAPKGRPTPKRSERNKRRGPVAPAPLTAAEARQRRKEARNSMTKEERKAEKVRQRSLVAQRNERMKSGDEAYLIARDRGPVRRYVRDIVDSRSNVLGLLMPWTFLLLVGTMIAPKLALYLNYAMPAVTIAMLVDGFLLSRRVNRAVDAKFPGNTESRGKLAMYAVPRAMQPRRWRVPRPQVARGAQVV
ncbi:MAG: DUF3043 domain-containing protein [Mycobacterium sp.]